MTKDPVMTFERGGTNYELRLAQGVSDLRAVQRLRYRVFVEEMGASGAGADHRARLEHDGFDDYADHLMLIDRRLTEDDPERVIGVYRLLTGASAAEAGGFYCDREYDLTPLKASGRSLVELGRSCVHPDHRRGAAMLHLWNGLADYVLSNGIEILFGVASFPGADPQEHALALSWLHAYHLAPPALRVTALAEHSHPLDVLPVSGLCRTEAMARIPPLIRGYLRLGGVVGDGAFVDHDFNTTDVCLIVDTSTMSERAFDHYARKAPRG